MPVFDKLDIQGAEVLGQNVMAFAHLLRANGIEVTTSRIIDTFRSLRAINSFRRDDFYIALQANCISHMRDQTLFDQLFQQFWSGRDGEIVPDPNVPNWEDNGQLPPPNLMNSQLQLEPGAGDDTEPSRKLAMYSPMEILTHKDFGNLSESELTQVKRLIASMARQMATALSRRKKARAKSHRIDQGRTTHDASELAVWWGRHGSQMARSQSGQNEDGRALRYQRLDECLYAISGAFT